MADSLEPKFTMLLLVCDGAPLVAGTNPPVEAAVFSAFLQGRAEGWLHEGLQQLGAAVWAAWPQKYACNDPECLEMGCLSEHSCSRQSCSACKVGPRDTLSCMVPGRHC